MSVGILGSPLALSMKTWSADVVLCTDGAPLEATWQRRLARNRLRAITHRIARCAHERGQLTALEFDGHPPLAREVISFTAAQRPRCQLAASMGCAFNEKGTFRTSLLSETNVPGVFVAGDASHDAQFVVVAAADGAKAALGINQALQRQELRR